MNERRKSVTAPPKSQTCLRVERIEAEREDRRRAMIERKQARAAAEERNLAAGNPGDVDFIGLVHEWRVAHASDSQPRVAQEPQQQRLCIAVRKRPVSAKERLGNDHDAVTCLHPTVWIHSAKLKVDGITKYLDHTSYSFDHAFDETVTTDEVYQHTTMPLVDFCAAGMGGRATVFAFGQTGSGKTHTMQGIQQILVEDLFLLLTDKTGALAENTKVMVSFFEMYGGTLQDLLNHRERLKVLEDGRGEIITAGLTEAEATSPEQLLQILCAGNTERTTHVTEANDTSSRSHAICQITLRDRRSDKLTGKLSLVDLAGSERGSDTKSHNAQRRAESADINTSLLALKECMRAMDSNRKGDKYVPYRSSKLTLILKDCFTSDRAMTTMIATISPGASAADHSLNTLRYADRAKDKSAKKSPQRTFSPVRRTAGAVPSASVHTVAKRGSSTTRTSGDEHRGVAPRPATTNTNDVLISNVDSATSDMWTTATTRVELEEAILCTHMSHIKKNAELLTMEGDILAQLQRPERSAQDIERYATALETILDQKENMILKLRQKMSALNRDSTEEPELSNALNTRG